MEKCWMIVGRCKRKSTKKNRNVKAKEEIYCVLFIPQLPKTTKESLPAHGAQETSHSISANK